MIKAYVDRSKDKAKIRIHGDTIEMAKELVYIVAAVLAQFEPVKGKTHAHIAHDIANEALKNIEYFKENNK